MTTHVVVAAGATLETAMLPARLLSLRSDYGAQVTAVVSPCALDFATLTALRAVTGREVVHEHTQLDPSSGEPMHLTLSTAALLVLHPASARIVAECALGIVSCSVTRQFAFTDKARVAVAPAIHPLMDKRIYVDHMSRLTHLGCEVLGGDAMHASWSEIEACIVRRTGLVKGARADVIRLDDLKR